MLIPKPLSLELVAGLLLAALPLSAASPQRLIKREGPPGTVTVNTATDFSIVFGRQSREPQQIACPGNAFITNICGNRSDRTTGNFARVFGLGAVSVKCSDGTSVDPFGIGNGQNCLNQPGGFTQIGIGHGSFIDRIRDINLPDGTNPQNFVGNLGGDINNVVAPVSGMKLVSLTISYGGFVGDPAHQVTFSFRVTCADLKCLECAAGPNTCSRCTDGSFLDSRTGTCVAGCPGGTFVAPGNVCQPCKEGCAACTDATTCSACSLDKTLKDGHARRHARKERLPKEIDAECFLLETVLWDVQDAAQTTLKNAWRVLRGFLRTETSALLPAHYWWGSMKWMANVSIRNAHSCRDVQNVMAAHAQPARRTSSGMETSVSLPAPGEPLRKRIYATTNDDAQTRPAKNEDYYASQDRNQSTCGTDKYPGSS
ncbi:hypothetical protein HK102_006654 [Quaeritorhiza haematococci]|nr:hypothetical protein HK102_006654 [Quaeritorhiza haematococci]